MRYLLKLFQCLACVLFISGCATTLSKEANSSPQVQAFINEMVVKYQFNRDELQQVFANVKFQPHIIQLMQTPHEAKPWYIYRTTFLTEARVNAGVKYWREHEQLLAKAEQEYGVPASIIVAILGVETYYGSMQGNFRVIDALSTLAFDYPPRAPFFKSELTHLLLMARAAKVNPEIFVGSYAGAFGKTQFMPSSYRRYAVAFHHDGYSDLINNDADAIASIANYFKQNGWRAHEAIASPVRFKTKDTYVVYAHKSDNNMKPNKAVSEWHKLGFIPTQTLPSSQLAALLILQQKQGFEYWLGLHNFYVLSRYNPRLNYAMAVYQLSQRINAQYNHRS